MSKQPRKKSLKKICNKDVTDFLKIPRLSNDRPINPSNFIEIDRDVQLHVGDDCTIRTISWTLVYVEELDMWFRINGNHTANVLKYYDLRNLNPITVHYEEYTVSTRKEALALYVGIDKATAGKQLKDVNRVIQADGGLRDVPVKVYNRALPSIVLALRGTVNRPDTETMSDRALIMDDPRNQRFVKWWHRVLKTVTTGGLKQSALLKVPIGCAAFRHLHENREYSVKFWLDVKKGEGKQGSPARKAHEFIKLMQIKSGQLPRTKTISLNGGKILVNNNIVVNTLDQLFRAYCKGQKSVIIKYDDSNFLT